MNVKRILYAMISVVMCILIVFSNSAVCVKTAKAAEYNVGDIIELGYYPQSFVTDEELIAELNSCEKTWISYDYYYTNDAAVYEQRDSMKYADIQFGGNKYRAVCMSEYRSSGQEYDSTQEGSFNVKLNTVYWFAFEPIEWKILDVEKGLIVSNCIIDCQAFSNKERNYDFATSDIRTWLNTDFAETALKETNGYVILETALDNSADPPDYQSTPCTEKIFLLSKTEAAILTGKMSDHGIYEDFILPAITDYALVQGALPRCGFLTRTPHIDGYCVTQINIGGHADHGNTTFAGYGICPAMCVDLGNTASTEKHGDVDGDGLIAASDARLALRAAVGLETLSQKQIFAADIDRNGKTEALDARYILRYSVGLIDDVWMQFTESQQV